MPHKKAKKSIRDANTKAAGYDNAPTANDMLPLANGHPKSAIPFAPQTKNQTRKAKAAPKLNSFGGRHELAGMSKSAHRILNAGAVREQYNAERKRRREEEDGKTGAGAQAAKSMAPLPYESLSAFNRRVEITLRPDINTAIRHSKASSTKNKNAKKSKATDGAPEGDDEMPKEGEAITSGNQKKTKVATAEESVDPFAKKQKVRTGPTEFEEASLRRNVNDVVQAPPTLKKARRGVAPTTRAEQALPAHRQPVSEAIKLMMEAEREKAIKQYRALKEQREAEQREAKEK